MKDFKCLCGCGANVARSFVPGHDAKLKSRAMRKEGRFSAAQREWLKKHKLVGRAK